jgi:hypothetical protein
MKKRFKDPYGCTAILTVKQDGTAHVISKTASGKTIRNSNHTSEKAAIAAIRRDSDGWMKVV